MIRCLTCLLVLAAGFSCSRDEDSPSSTQDIRQPEPQLRYLGAIEVSDGEQVHWGTKTRVFEVLTDADISFSLGATSVGLAELWCEPDDYERAIELLAGIDDLAESGFESAGDLAGMTMDEISKRSGQE